MSKSTKYESIAEWQYDLLTLYQKAFAQILAITDGQDDVQTAFSDAEYFIFSKQDAIINLTKKLKADKLLAKSNPELLAQIAQDEKEIKALTIQMVKELKAEIAKSKLDRKQKRKLFRRCLRVCNLPAPLLKRLERAKDKRAKQFCKKVRNQNAVMRMLRDNVGYNRYLITIYHTKKRSNATLDKRVEEILSKLDNDFRVAYASETGETRNVYHYHLIVTSEKQRGQIRSYCKKHNLKFNSLPITDNKCSYYNLAKYVNKSGKLWKLSRQKTKINPHFSKRSKVKNKR